VGITVFFLICGPFAALLYVPLTTRKHVKTPRNAAQPQMAAAQEFQPIHWNRAQDTIRNWKSAA
jgi:hypothetical protein